MKKKWFEYVSIIVIMIMTIPSYAYARGAGELITSLLVVFVVAAIIFLILREVMCWYWKINESVALFKKIINRDDMIIKLLTDIRDDTKIAKSAKIPDENGEEKKTWTGSITVPKNSDVSVIPESAKIPDENGEEKKTWTGSITVPKNSDVSVIPESAKIPDENSEEKKTWTCTCGAETSVALSNCSRCRKFRPRES